MLMMITFYHQTNQTKTSNSFLCRQAFYYHYQIKIPIDFLYKQESFDHKRLHQLIGTESGLLLWGAKNCTQYCSDFSFNVQNQRIH